MIYDLKSPQESLNGQLYNKQNKESFIRDTESVRDRFWIKSRDFWETANVIVTTLVHCTSTNWNL